MISFLLFHYVLAASSLLVNCELSHIIIVYIILYIIKKVIDYKTN